MINEWSLDDDSSLSKSRLQQVLDSTQSLKLRTDGYSWYKQNKLGSDKMISINPRNKYTVTESLEFTLGNVDNLWVVDSGCYKGEKSLKIRAKERMENRALPSSQNFNEYMEMRTSCWIIEEVQGDYFCDCPICAKVIV